MMLQSDDPLAIPLWINGHAYLTVAPSFREVRNPLTGAVLRRTPLCSQNEAMKAIESAQAALPGWIKLEPTRRSSLLAELGEALAGYANHFSKLIAEETGRETSITDAEVTMAVATLRSSVIENLTGVLLIAGAAAQTFPDLLVRAAPALRAGATVVLRPDPETPSAIFALAELTSRCGFPPGVFNILHCETATLDSLPTINGFNLLLL